MCSPDRYGRTQAGALVDMDRLEFLAGSGHDRRLAAEALRQVGRARGR